MRSLFALIFLGIVIAAAINFKALFNSAEKEITFPGLSGKFYSQLVKQDKSGQVDQKFFQSAKVKLNDYRENKREILDVKILGQAFKGKGGPPIYEIVIDVFEAKDDLGKSAAKAIFQINLIEIKTQNKIAEMAISID